MVRTVTDVAERDVRPRAARAVVSAHRPGADAGRTVVARRATGRPGRTAVVGTDRVVSVAVVTGRVENVVVVTGRVVSVAEATGRAVTVGV